VGFTKEQRLKGLMKQLRNLGYDVIPTGEASASPEEPSPASPSMEERGAHTLARMKIQQDEGEGF